MDTTIDDATAAERSRTNKSFRPATREIMERLTLADVVQEFADYTAHITWSQEDIEHFRIALGLPPRDPPLPDNVVKFKPRARVAPNHGGNAA